jgi:hypothetical protein
LQPSRVFCAALALCQQWEVHAEQGVGVDRVVIGRGVVVGGDGRWWA